MSVTHKDGPFRDELVDPALTFPYEPDHFQKHSFQAMEDGQHVLVTAHTGSGKTTVAEYAVALGVKSGKKVIYTAPIKALSNQIFGDFSRKYPHWSIGIRTGDIDARSEEAQVVIMTTEILLNMLYQQKGTQSGTTMDTEGAGRNVPKIAFSDVSMVVFDEVHYIKDKERGSVWERSIMMMPDHIQMVLLSATLPDADKFCKWIASCKGRDVTHTTTPFRAVPLTHYVQCEDERIMIMDQHGKFDPKEYQRAMKGYTFMPSEIDRYIKKFKLPALLFCFSKKHCQGYAKKIVSPLVTSEEQSAIHKKFHQLLRRFNGHKDLMAIKQTQEVERLVSRGVCYHHAGLLPPLKEIIQELFSCGLVKVLFVTETFAAGVNMPAKTVVFTGIQKYDDHVSGFRTLLPEEYGQMAGRAGRRGMDTVGTVIHLPFNLSQHPEMYEVQSMMCGKIRDIVSQITPSYHHLFNAVLNGVPLENDGSLLRRQTTERVTFLKGEQEKMQAQFDESSKQARMLIEDNGCDELEFVGKVMRYNDFHCGRLKGNARKKYHKSGTEEWYTANQEVVEQYNQIMDKRMEAECSLERLDEEIFCLQTGEDEEAAQAMNFLIDSGYMTLPDSRDGDGDGDELEVGLLPCVTTKGIMAAGINEVNSLLLTELITADYLSDLDERELIAVLAVFLNARDVDRQIVCPSRILKRLAMLDTLAEECGHAEWSQSPCHSEWTLGREFCDMAYSWTGADNIEQVYADTGSTVQVGEFVRMMIKLNNVCREVVHAAQICHKDELCHKLQRHHELLIKGVVFPQSLYVMTSSSSMKNG